jgi:hypothetical protein
MGGHIKLSSELTVVFVLSLLILGNLVVNSAFCATTESDEASLRIADAESALRQAFKKVLTAEQAGANVGDLLSKLNEAGDLLTEAESAYANGNVSEAMENANSSILIANTIANEALDLQTSARTNNQNVFWQTLAFSLVGIAVLIIALFVVWTKFKTSRSKKLSALKPEVTSNVDI